METIDWAALAAMAAEADQPPAPGNHPVVCETAEWATTANGKPMIKLRHRITAGSDANKAVFDQLVVSKDNPRAMAIFFQKLRAFGLEPAHVQAVSQEEVPNLLIGRTVQVTIKTDRLYQGRPSVDVESYNVAGGAAPPPGGGASPAPVVAPAPAPSSTPPPLVAPAPAVVAPTPAPTPAPAPQVAAPPQEVAPAPAPVAAPAPVPEVPPASA